MVGGEENVSRFRDLSLNEDYDVQLRLREGQRNDPETILRLYVPRQGEGLLRLDNVVQLASAQSASRIDRLDR
jgi:hydrophobic/amphiphilic exporter-1 (mainly G- bacteria), HAE1 family